MNRKKKTSSLPAYESLFFSKTADFLDVYLVRQAGKSPYTRKAYKAGLSSFYDYVTEVLQISPMVFQFSQCSYQLVLGYSQYLQETMKLKNRVCYRLLQEGLTVILIPVRIFYKARIGMRTTSIVCFISGGLLCIIW